MGSTSKAGAIVGTLFALPFLGVGLYLLITFGQQAYTRRDPALVFLALFGLVFAGAGAAIMGASWKAYHAGVRRDQLRYQHRGEPWMWQDDWAAGRISGHTTGSVVGAWAVAIAVSGFTGFIAWRIVAQKNVPPVAKIIICVIALVGVFLIGRAIRLTLQTLRFGVSWFEFQPGSIRLGQPLRGNIHLRLNVNAAHGFDLKLSCIRRIVTGAGKNRNVQENVLWSDTRNVPGDQVQRGMDNNALVPVEFIIPADGVETNHAIADDQLLWRIAAKADIPGVDFTDEYEVPVFRAEGADAAQASAFGSITPLSSMLAAGAAAVPIAFSSVAPEQIPAPASTPIHLKQDERGTVLDFRPFRNPAQAIGLLFVNAIWGGVVYVLWHVNSPWIFRIVFSAAMLLMFYGLLNALFGSQTVIANSDGVIAQTRLLGIERKRSYAAADLKSVSVDVSRESGMQKGLCGLELLLQSGKKTYVAAGTLTRAEALWCAKVVDEALGRQANIALDFQAFGRPLPR